MNTNNLLIDTKLVTIWKNPCEEYEVPEKNGELYFTDDREDAITTAQYIYGDDAAITFRVRRNN